MGKPWDNIISEDEQNAYNAAGFASDRHGPASGSPDHRRAVSHRRHRPAAVLGISTSCGDVGWRAVKQIEPLLGVFRSNGWPVLYPYVSPKETFDRGRLSDKVPA